MIGAVIAIGIAILVIAIYTTSRQSNRQEPKDK